MNTDTAPTTAPDTNTPDTPPAPPALVFFVEGMDTPARMALAMRALADLLPVEFPDPPARGGSNMVSVHVTSCEVSIHVMAAKFVDAAMTGKIVGVETHEVYHAGPNRPPTIHYAAWFPNLLPGQVRLKVVSCETLG